MFVICHVRLLVGIQFHFATVHSSMTQPEPASIGSVLPRFMKLPTKFADGSMEFRGQFAARYISFQRKFATVRIGFTKVSHGS